jgi:hypothetical protein
VALAESVVGDAGVSGDLVEGAALELCESEEISLIVKKL